MKEERPGVMVPGPFQIEYGHTNGFNINNQLG